MMMPSVVDGHGAGLNHRLAGKIALGGHQRPDAIEDIVVAREGGDRDSDIVKTTPATAALILMGFLIKLPFSNADRDVKARAVTFR